MKDREPAEDVLGLLGRKAGDYVVVFGSCAQGTLLALQEQFDMESPLALKSATAMPGIALRGETCGAVIGSLMALGMAFGREKPEDIRSVVRTMGAARDFCRRFEDEFGGCMCREVQQKLFGRSFDLADPTEQVEFVKAGAAEKCRIPAETAARIAGRLIIEGQGKSD